MTNKTLMRAMNHIHDTTASEYLAKQFIEYLDGCGVGESVTLDEALEQLDKLDDGLEMTHDATMIALNAIWRAKQGV